MTLDDGQSDSTVLAGAVALGTLQSLQDSVALSAGAAIVICDTDGGAITAPSGPPRLTAQLKQHPQSREGVAKSSQLQLLISAQGQTIGEILAIEPDDTPQDSTALLLSQLAILLGRLCEQQQQLKYYRVELDALAKVSTLLAEPRQLNATLRTIVKTIARVMGCRSCGVRVLQEDGELKSVATFNLSQTYLHKGPVVMMSSHVDKLALAGEAVMIEDMGDDPRIMYPQQARAEGLVSSLAVGMSYHGNTVGTIRIYHDHVHRFTAGDVAMLRTVAAAAAAAIVNGRLYEEQRRAQRIAEQMRLAGEVQRRMLPAKMPDYPTLDVFGLYEPSYDVGGDFYDFINLPNQNLGVVIADVIGKGVPASLMGTGIRGALRAHAEDLYDIDAIISKVNRSMCADTRIDQFATLFYGVIDSRKLSLTYCNAGHEPPLLFRNGDPVLLEEGGMIIGVDPDAPYVCRQIRLKKGDILLLLTDGVFEAMNFKEEVFGGDRTQAAIKATADNSAEHIAKHLIWEVRRFAGLAQRHDDTSIVVIKVR